MTGNGTHHMKSKRLLMVTAAYPYGHGESFVKAELDHISRYFEAVEVVPCSCPAGSKPRQLNQPVNLEYAIKRWGALRKFHMMSSFALALWKYKWLKEVFRIVGQAHKFENLKELARTLYRANLFERFLRAQAEENGKEFDLVYFYWIVPEILGAAGYRNMSDPALKIVSRAHGGDLYEDRRAGGYVGLHESIVAAVDEVYCISDHGKSYLEGKYPAIAEKLHTARLGVADPGYLNGQPGDETLSIVSCSFVVAGKRLHLIVDAIAFLLARYPALKIKWTHIGDGELFEQVRACVGKLRAGAEVVFTGYLAQDKVMALYRDESFDVIVNVSDCEGIPVSLMEASSAGIPMVATDVGGTSEIVNTANGILIPGNSDGEAIGSALMRFKDRASAAAYRQRARSSWDEKFNAQVNYESFGQELIELLERRANGAGWKSDQR